MESKVSLKIILDTPKIVALVPLGPDVKCQQVV
jgi:hypothetical protein